MKILITGGAGYIGTVLTEQLLARGDEVVVYDSLVFGAGPVLPFFRNPKYSLVADDIRNATHLEQAVKGVDAVIHLAAIVGYPACDRDPRTTQEVNVHGTMNVKRAAAGRPIVFASTGSVYGKLEVLCSENVDPNPLTFYGQSKLYAETILLENGDPVIYRFATAFGLSPRLRLDLLPNTFTYQAVKERTLVIYEAHFRRTFLHVQDIARALIHAVDNYDAMKGQVFNCGDNSMNTTKRDLAEMIGQYVTYDRHYVGNGHDPDVRDYEVDYSRLNSTGYHATVLLEQGIAEMVRAFQHLSLPNPYQNAVR